jgi:hypothetical protein
MKKTIQSAIVMAGAILVCTGCASGPRFAEVSKTFPALSPGQGRVYVYRKAVLGAAVQPQVKLNGEAVGRAVPKGFFYVDRAPGEYKISTTTEVERSLSMLLGDGETRYVRLGISLGFFVGHVYPELVEDRVGEKEIQKCSYTGPTNCKP